MTPYNTPTAILVLMFFFILLFTVFVLISKNNIKVLKTLAVWVIYSIFYVFLNITGFCLYAQIENNVNLVSSFYYNFKKAFIVFKINSESSKCLIIYKIRLDQSLLLHLVGFIGTVVFSILQTFLYKGDKSFIYTINEQFFLKKTILLLTVIPFFYVTLVLLSGCDGFFLYHILYILFLKSRLNYTVVLWNRFECFIQHGGVVFNLLSLIFINFFKIMLFLIIMYLSYRLFITITSLKKTTYVITNDKLNTALKYLVVFFIFFILLSKLIISLFSVNVVCLNLLHIDDTLNLCYNLDIVFYLILSIFLITVLSITTKFSISNETFAVLFSTFNASVVKPKHLPKDTKCDSLLFKIEKKKNNFNFADYGLDANSLDLCNIYNFDPSVTIFSISFLLFYLALSYTTAVKSTLLGIIVVFLFRLFVFKLVNGLSSKYKINIIQLVYFTVRVLLNTGKILLILVIVFVIFLTTYIIILSMLPL